MAHSCVPHWVLPSATGNCLAQGYHLPGGSLWPVPGRHGDAEDRVMQRTGFLVSNEDILKGPPSSRAPLRKTEASDLYALTTLQVGLALVQSCLAYFLQV